MMLIGNKCDMEDITDEKSFGNIRNWIRNIEHHATESVNKMLIGNKCDMEDKRVIDFERGKALADEYGIGFLETSAKNSVNVEKAFITLAKDIKKRLIDTPDSDQKVEEKNGLKITPSTDNAQQKGGSKCCSRGRGCSDAPGIGPRSRESPPNGRRPAAAKPGAS